MFNKSKYTKWYFSIIKKPNKNNELYTEKHHIIPKSLGGNNKKENLVKLSAREHYICHLLLIKMLNDEQHKQKMKYALWCLINGFSKNKKKINSKIFQKIRQEHSEHLSKIRKGKKHTDETKNKIGKASKQKIFTEEYRKKISESSKKRKHSPESIEAIRKKSKERWALKSLEERKNILKPALLARKK
jgi:hypothetical protein